MYNERKDSFSIKGLIVQILFIVLFVFILIWLFPTKGDIDKNGGNNSQDFDVLTNRIFNENLQIMKEAAISYYTTSRLPKNVNDVESMTLRKMLEEKLLIEFKDANNNSCDLDESYVEITKLEEEYILKVNLSCTDNDAYILVHLGCYDYCLTDVCENKDIPASQPIENKPMPEPEPTPEPDIPQSTCSHKYQKVVSNYIWSNWSDWSTKEEKADASKQVETKEKQVTETREVTDYVDKEEEDKTKPIWKEVQVKIDDVSAQYCSSYSSQYTETGEKKYEWIDEGTNYYVTHPVDGSNTKYIYEGSTPSNCGDCDDKVLYIYRKYTLKTYNVVSEQEVCSSWETVTVPIFISVPEIIGYETKTVKVPVTRTETYTTMVKYYKSRTLSITYNTLTEWSSIKEDQNLINQGYKYVTSVCK